MEALQRQETACPEFWDSTYRISGSYMPWKTLRNFYIGMHCGKFLKPEATHKSRTVILTLRDAGAAADALGYPFYVVSQTLLAALQETDMDEELNIEEDCPLPFDSFTFLLPKGTLILSGENSEEPADCLGLHVCLLRNKRTTDHSLTRDIVCVHFLANYGLCGMATYSLVQGKLVCSQVENQPEYGENRTAAYKVVVLLMKLLAAMAAEPKLIEAPAVESRRPARKDKRPLTFLTPRYLGLRFKWDHGPDWQASSAHEGQSRRPHMRRGHIRRQQVGSRSLPREERQHKILFIKPQMIGVKLRDEAAAPPGDGS